MVINTVKSVFARHGVPKVSETDNGAQCSSKKFADFSRDWGFEHWTASLHYSRSNGVAESVVKTIKHMLKKCLETVQDLTKLYLPVAKLFCRMAGHQ